MFTIDTASAILLALHRSAETGTVVSLSYDDSSHGVCSPLVTSMTELRTSLNIFSAGMPGICMAR